MDKSYSHGLLFQASYTFSKAIDQGASFENELNPLNFNATRGLSLLDAKHRFVFSPYWELPVPKYDGFKGKALDGWGISAIITYQSGFPIRVQDQNDTELQTSFFFEDANTPTMTAPVQRHRTRKRTTDFWFDHNAISAMLIRANVCVSDRWEVRQHSACAVLRAGDQQYGSGDFKKDSDQ